MSERGHEDYGLGPQFIATPDGPMFAFGIDAHNVVGPHKARKADKLAHPNEWRAFEDAQAEVLAHPPVQPPQPEQAVTAAPPKRKYHRKT